MENRYELYHHGIKGQKWGVRRYQNPDGTYTAAGRERYFVDKGSINRHDRAANRIQQEIRGLEYERDRQRAKADAKRAKVKNIKDAVKKYNEVSEKAYKLQDIADEADMEMRAAYKNLGKTNVSRVIRAFKGTIGKGSEAYTRYSKAYDRAVQTQEIADDAWVKATAAYQNTGKNYVNRVFNNVKYDPVWSEKSYKKSGNN